MLSDNEETKNYIDLLLNDSGLFEAGAKVSNINSKSILTQYNFENDE